MFIINNTKAQIRLPIKSLKQIVVLGVGEKSPELKDNLYNEVIKLSRAFGLEIEDYAGTQVGSVERTHQGTVIASDPKANSGDSRSKARIAAANDKALAKAKAVSDAAKANNANADKAKAARAEADEAKVNDAAKTVEVKADEVETTVDAKASEAKAGEAEKTVDAKTETTTKTAKKSATRPRRKPLARKAKDAK